MREGKGESAGGRQTRASFAMNELKCEWGTVTWDRTGVLATTLSGQKIPVIQSVHGIKDVQHSALWGHILVFLERIESEPLRMGKVESGMALLWSLRSIDVCNPAFFSRPSTS